MESVSRPVMWGAIAVPAVAAVLLAIFGGTIGAIICAVVAIGLALFSSALRRA